MSSTLLELWTSRFPNGSPDANRDQISAAGDPVRNPLSEVSGLDSEYTSNSPLPTGRRSKAIAILWNALCDNKADEDSSLNHLTSGFGQGDRDQDAGTKADKFTTALRKNVTVRHIAQEAIAAQPEQRDNSYRVTQAATAAQPQILAPYTRGNYRLGSSNPEGTWGNFTGRPSTNGGDDITTITLSQYRDGMI